MLSAVAADSHRPRSHPTNYHDSDESQSANGQRHTAWCLKTEADAKLHDDRLGANCEYGIWSESPFEPNSWNWERSWSILLFGSVRLVVASFSPLRAAGTAISDALEV